MPALETLLSTLESIPVEEARDPRIPAAVVLQEAHDLRAVLEVDDTTERLLAVGLHPSTVAELPAAIEAAREAQSRWIVVRDPSKPQGQREREDAGLALRRELVASCRWNLRDDDRAQSVLDSIVQGDGLPDLVQDLRDLAMLIDLHPEAFDADGTFDAAAQAEQARALASEIAVGLAEDRASADQQAAKLLRDRAFTHLEELVADIRSAGRYAFRDVPRRLVAFASAYRRRRRRSALGREAPSGTAVSAIVAS